MRKALSSLLFVVAVGVVGTACVASGTARYSASAEMPSMVYIGPDVQVIEDYDEPVFYSANVYWRYNGGVWYQSRTYTGGWVTVSSPPPAIVRIQTPTMYVHYRASAHAGAQANGQGNGQGNARAAEVQQDHREQQAEKHEEKQQEKAEKREEKQQEKAEKREEKQQEKQDKHDDKHDNGKGHK